MLAAQPQRSGREVTRQRAKLAGNVNNGTTILCSDSIDVGLSLIGQGYLPTRPILPPSDPTIAVAERLIYPPSRLLHARAIDSTCGHCTRTLACNTRRHCKMANVFRGLASRLPNGMGTGLTALGLAGTAVYGISESMFTVEGGHRAIIFSRLNGVLDDVLGEGLHFRVPWFQYPIIYDVRTKPHRITSLTGTKGRCIHILPRWLAARPLADGLMWQHWQRHRNTMWRVLFVANQPSNFFPPFPFLFFFPLFLFPPHLPVPSFRPPLFSFSFHPPTHPGTHNRSADGQRQPTCAVAATG